MNVNASAISRLVRMCFNALIPIRCAPLFLATIFSLVPLLATTGYGSGVSEEEWSEDVQFDRAVRLLKRATHAGPDGEYLLLLRGLRQMHDPKLLPFFTTLCQSTNPIIKVHALLAVADLSEPKRIDAWKLHQLEQVELRRGALAQAIKDDMVGAKEYREILAWSDLDDSIKSVVLVMLVKRGITGEEIEQMVTLMNDSGSPIVRARCAVALLDLQKPEGTQEALDSLEDLPRSIREEAVSNLLGLIRSESLENTKSWVKTLNEREDISVSLRLEIVRMLLDMYPEDGRVAWKKMYESSTSLANKLRSALVLLSSVKNVGADDFKPVLEDSFPILAAMGEAGAAVASGSPATEECLHLLSFHHPASAVWVFDHARTLTDTNKSAAATILSALVEGTMEDGPAMEERLELAVMASGILTKVDPELLRERLDETVTQQRRLTQEAILAGAWQSGSQNSNTLIHGVSEWTSTRAGSLAVLISAEYEEINQLDGDDLKRLTLIFGGAGQVSPGNEVQAAWLFLRHTGQEGAALALVLGDLSQTKPGKADE